MKKTLFFLLVFCSLVVRAQDCTTVWPYLYPDFTEGAVNKTSGSTVNYKLNIHVKESKLHFLSGNLVNQAFLMDVASVRIGEDIYIPVRQQQLMKVVAQEGENYALKLVVADLSSLNETGGAYGMGSSTSATNKLSSIETDAQINQNHMLLKASKNNGESLDLETTYYFLLDGELLEAAARVVEKKIAPQDKAAWKQFKKDNKVRWNNEESLSKVLGFLVSTKGNY